MKSIIKCSKLLIDGFVEKEVSIKLYIFWKAILHLLYIVKVTVNTNSFELKMASNIPFLF
jgi:hypothetical protein